MNYPNTLYQCIKGQELWYSRICKAVVPRQPAAEPEAIQAGVTTKMPPTNSVIYGTLRYTLQAIRCCASYILLNRLGLGINSEFLCH